MSGHIFNSNKEVLDERWKGYLKEEEIDGGKIIKAMYGQVGAFTFLLDDLRSIDIAFEMVEFPSKEKGGEPTEKAVLFIGLNLGYTTKVFDKDQEKILRDLGGFPFEAWRKGIEASLKHLNINLKVLES